jgi:hypothetical protein
MKKENKIENKNIVNREVISFQNELQAINNTATDWYNIEYTNSNTKFYSVFAKLYKLYETCTSTTDANTQKANWLKKQCENKGVKFSKKKPTIQNLLINFAFFVEGLDYANQQKRISSYVRVFTTATATDDVRANNIANWIADNGGIENIRQKTSPSAITKEMRIKEGNSFLNRFETIANVSNNKTIEYANEKTNEVVLLVGILQADGSVAIKHTIFKEENGSTIKGSTTINTALCNVYSKHKEAEAKEAKLQNAEKDATDKAVKESNTIANANVENVEVERKVA